MIKAYCLAIDNWKLEPTTSLRKSGGEFDCSVEKSVEFSVEYYCIKKLNF